MTTTLDELRRLRPREAAEVLGISVRQLDRLVEEGVLRPVRLTENANRRFRARDIAALVAAHPRRTTIPGLSLIPDRREALAKRLDLDPWTMTPERVIRRIGQMQERAARSYADTDPTGTLRLDRVLPKPVQKTASRDGRTFSDEERALGDALDDYMGIPAEDRVRAFEETDELRDPTGLLRL